MPCGKVTITKNYKCDKEYCFCIPTDGCYCPCGKTGSYSCICVCKDERGNIKTCVGCSGVPSNNTRVCKSVGTCRCKECTCVNTEGRGRGSRPSSISCGKTGAGKCLCHARVDSCVCNEKNIKTCEGKESIARFNVLESASSGTECDGKSGSNCKCKGNSRSCVCVCENEQGELVCYNDCKCDDNNKCDKEGCSCIPKDTVAETGVANSCICVCKNEQGELVCCNDCKCDNNNKCDKEGCSSIPKDTVAETGVANSCIYVCKNEQGELVCCNDCKCDENNKCDKEGCSSIPKDTVAETGVANSCICVCKNEQGELVCCNDCKCDENNRCDKAGCACITEDTKTEAAKSSIIVEKNSA